MNAFVHTAHVDHIGVGGEGWVFGNNVAGDLGDDIGTNALCAVDEQQARALIQQERLYLFLHASQIIFLDGGSRERYVVGAREHSRGLHLLLGSHVEDDGTMDDAVFTSTAQNHIDRLWFAHGQDEYYRDEHDDNECHDLRRENGFMCGFSF